MEQQDGPQDVQLLLGQKLFLIRCRDVPDIEKVQLAEDVQAILFADGTGATSLCIENAVWSVDILLNCESCCRHGVLV